MKYKKTRILEGLKEYNLEQLIFYFQFYEKVVSKKKIALEIITSYVPNVLLGGLGHEYSC